MHFQSQQEYEKYYSPTAKAGRSAEARVNAEAATTEAFAIYRDGDKEGAAACLSDAGFENDAIASWFALWR